MGAFFTLFFFLLIAVGNVALGFVLTRRLLPELLPDPDFDSLELPALPSDLMKESLNTLKNTLETSTKSYPPQAEELTALFGRWKRLMQALLELDDEAKSASNEAQETWENRCGESAKQGLAELLELAETPSSGNAAVAETRGRFAESCRHAQEEAAATMCKLASGETNVESRCQAVREIWSCCRDLEIELEAIGLAVFEELADLSHFPPELLRDASTLLRLGWEERLDKLKLPALEQEKPLLLALLDINQLKAVNRHFGPRAGDLILKAVARIAALHSAGKEVPARLADGRLILALGTSLAEEAAEEVEKIRQTVEQTLFEYEGTQHQVYLNCAVILRRAEVSSDELLEALSTTMQEAKRFCSNRTFLWEKDTPMLVVPPDLEIAPQTVLLAGEKMEPAGAAV